MPAQYIVRYSSLRHLGEFTAKDEQRFARYSEVIVRTDRGVEWGQVLCESDEQARKRLGRNSSKGRILREASDNDHRILDDANRTAREEFDGCGEMITERKLQMQLVDVEHVFGGERLIFYYIAEKRVDFRELVRALASKFRTRIEMRQIGVRDEAKLLADYGDCGRPVCCNTHLTDMPPVSMKMAKIQKASLDPTKLSGRCGRLKCCLRYEYDTYEESRRELPRVGATVVTKVGQGRVVGQELLNRQVVVQYEDRRRILTEENEILTVVNKSATKKKDAPHEETRKSDVRNPQADEGSASKPDQSPPAAEAPPVKSDDSNPDPPH